MKTLAVITGLLMLTLEASSQSIIDKLFDKYSGAEGFTTVYISKYMFDMFRNHDNSNTSSNEGKNQDEMEHLISNLNGIKILATDEDSGIPAPVNLYQEIMKVLPASKVYKEIMVVKDKGQNVRFYAKEEKGRVVELLLVVGEKDHSALISIQGDIDMKNISKLANTFNVEGMENLDKMKK